MQVPTLKELLLNQAFSYKDLIRACRPEGKRTQRDVELASVTGCDWEAWRTRALIDYGIPPPYFDLALVDFPAQSPNHFSIPARNISGQQRYLEIATRIQILPESGVNLIRGQVSGVYEALAGIHASLKWNDPVGIQIFFPRLKQPVIDFLKRKVSSQDDEYFHLEDYRFAAFQQLVFLLFGEEEGLAELLSPLKLRGGAFRDKTPYYMPSDSKSFIEIQSHNKGEEGPKIEDPKGLRYLIKSGCMFALNQVLNDPKLHTDIFFQSVIRSGNEEMLRRALPIFMPELIEIFDSTPQPSFEILPKKSSANKPQGILPFMPVLQAQADYLNFAIYSCNPRFVDVFLSFYNMDLIPATRMTYLSAGYLFHRNPVGAYQVLQKFKQNVTSWYSNTNFDLDMILYSVNARKTGYYNSHVAEEIRDNTGNIPVVQTLLPLLEEQLSEEIQFDPDVVIGAINDLLSKVKINLTPLTHRILLAALD